MTPVQIAYFKHFLFDRSLQKHYIGTYRKKRQKENPESLEEFLQEASLAKAIMGAFYFMPGSEYGFDYWNDIKEKWLKYWELYQDNPKNDSYMFLKGGFSILRQNWDKPFYFERETPEETYERMHIERPDIDEGVFIKGKSSPVTKFRVGDFIKGTISGDICKVTGIDIEHGCYLVDDDGAIDFSKEEYWDYISEDLAEITASTIIEPESETEKEEPEEEASHVAGVLEGFTLVETSNDGHKKLRTNTVSVNLNPGSYKVTFSAKDSDKIIKCNHKFANLLTKKETGEIAITFSNNASGCKVTVRKTTSNSVSINSIEMVKAIQKFYKQEKTFFRLEVVDTARINDNLTYILKLDE